MTSMFGGTRAGETCAARWLLAALMAGAMAASGCGEITRGDPDGAPGDDGGDTGEVDAGQGGADAGPPSACDPGGNPTYDEAWACLAQSACSLVSRCLQPLDAIDCRGSEIALFGDDNRIQIERVREAMEAGTVAYHAEEVAACVEWVTSVECTYILQLGDFDYGDFCGAFTGTVADGGACYDELECATAGASCGFASACTEEELCCALTCIPPAALGNDCSGAPCQGGEHCVAGICRSGETGSPCAAQVECDPEYWCDTVAGTCQPDVTTGMPCTQEEHCLPPDTCLGNNLSGSTEGTCGRSDRPGDACDGGCVGFACQLPSDSELGTCVDFAGEGDSCAAVPCGPATQCTDGSCAARGDVGAPCQNSYPDCRTAFFCDREVTQAKTGTCSDRLPDGSTCSTDRHCASGICNPGTLVCDAFPGCYP